MNNVTANELIKIVKEKSIETEKRAASEKIIIEAYREDFKLKNPHMKEDQIEAAILKMHNAEVDRIHTAIAGINSGKIDEIVSLTGESIMLNSKNNARKSDKYIEKIGIEKTYREIDIKNNFFNAVEEIGSSLNSTDKNQTGMQLVNKTIAFDSINYSQNNGKTAQTAAKAAAAKKFFDGAQQFMTWDMEVLSGTDKYGERKLPIPTELGYAISDKSGNIIKSATIMPGLSKVQADEIRKLIGMNEHGEIIGGSLLTGKDRTNLEQVVLERLGIYGDAGTKIGYHASGPMKGMAYLESVAEKSDGRRYTTKDYANGIKKLEEIYKTQSNLPKDASGLSQVELAIADMLSKMTDEKMPVVDFNGKRSDNIWINQFLATMNMDEASKKAFMKKAGLNNMHLNTSSERFLDLRPIFQDARNAAGISGIYSKEALNNMGRYSSGSQEGISNGLIPRILRSIGGTAHTAETDAKVLGKLVLARDAVGMEGESVLDNLFNIAYKAKNTEPARLAGNGKNLFYANNSTPWGEKYNNPLSYTFDPFTGTRKTANGFSIGDIIEKDLVSENPIRKGMTYTFDWMKEIEMSDEWVKKMNGTHSGYVQKKMFAVQMSPYVDKKIAGSHQMSQGHSVLFFNSSDEAEAYISQLYHIGTRNSIDQPFAFPEERAAQIKNDFKLTTISKDGVESSAEPINPNAIVKRSTTLYINENAARHARENSYKKASNFSELNAKLKAYAGKGDISKKEANEILLKIMQEKDRKISKTVASGKVLEISADDFMKAIGWNSKNGPKVITNSIDNTMAAYDYLASGDKIFGAIEKHFNESGYSKQQREERYPQLIENLTNAKMVAMNEEISSSNKLYRNSTTYSTYAKDSNFFEVSKDSIRKEKYGKYINTIASTSDDNIFRVNLDEGKEFDLINNLLRENNSKLLKMNPKQQEIEKLNVLRRFIKGIQKHENMFENFSDNVISGYEKSEHFASDILNALRKIREDNNRAGRRVQTQDVGRPYEIMELLSGDANLNELIKSADASIHKTVYATKDEMKIYAKSIVENMLVDDVDPYKHYKAVGMSEEGATYAKKVYDQFKREYTDNIAKMMNAYSEHGISIIYDEKIKDLIAVDSTNRAMGLNLPKLKVQDGGMHIELGGNKVALTSHISTGKGKSFDPSLVSVKTIMDKSFGSVNFQSMASNGVRNNDLFGSLSNALSQANKILRENPDVSGNDVLDIQKITELNYQELFEISHEMNKLGMFDGEEWKDSSFIKTVSQKDFSYKNAKSSDREAFAKDAQKVLKILADAKGEKGDDTLLSMAAEYLSLTGKENSVSESKGMVGPISHSTMIEYNANGRPVVNQTRYHAYRESDWKKAASSEQNAKRAISIRKTTTISGEKLMNARNLDGIGKTASILELRGASISEIGYRALITDHYNKKGKLSRRDRAVKKILSGINFTEQQQLIDSRVVEEFFPRTQIQKITATEELDILNNINKDTIKKVNELAQSNYKFEIDSGGNIVFSYGKGIDKAEKDLLFTRNGHGDTVEAKLAKMNGVFNKGFFSKTGGILATEEEVARVASGASSIDEAIKLVRNVFDENWYVKSEVQMPYRKFSIGVGAEKGQTKIPTMPLGEGDDRVFAYLNSFDKSLIGKTLTSEEIEKQIISKYDGKKTSLSKAELRKAIYNEMHSPAAELFGEALGGDVSIMINANEIGHANYGAAVEKEIAGMKQHLIANGYSEKDAIEKVYSDITNEDHRWIGNERVKLVEGQIEIPSFTKDDYIDSNAYKKIMLKPEYASMEENARIVVNGRQVGRRSMFALADQVDHNNMTGKSLQDDNSSTEMKKALDDISTGHKISDREINTLGLDKYNQTKIDFMQDKLSEDEFIKTYSHTLAKDSEGFLIKNGSRYVINKDDDGRKMLGGIIKGYENQFLSNGTSLGVDGELEKNLNRYYKNEAVKKGIASIKNNYPDISKETAELLYSSGQSLNAVNFNASSEKNLKRAQRRGFELIGIEDLSTSTNDGLASIGNKDSFFNKNLIIDIGKEVPIENRYTAIPYVQSKMAGEEVIQNGFQHAIKTVSNAHNNLIDFDNGVYRGPDGTTRESLINNLTLAQQVLKKEVDYFGYSGKKGNFGQFNLRVEGSAISKLSGISVMLPGDFNKNQAFDPIREAYEESANIYGKKEALKEINNSILSDSMFMGKTVLENYNEGAYIGAYYGGEDIFKKMGILGDENYLKKTGFNSQEELINHLKTNGLVVQAHRSPTIYTSSISPSILYYNDRIKGNEVMTTIEEVLGKNGDFDGDNGMFSVIRDESGRDSIQSGGEGKLWKDIQAEQVYRARTEGTYYHDKAVNIYIKDSDNIKNGTYLGITEQATLGGRVLGAATTDMDYDFMNENSKIVDEFRRLYGKDFDVIQKDHIKDADAYLSTIEDVTARDRYRDAISNEYRQKKYDVNTMAKTRKGTVGEMNNPLYRARQSIDLIFDDSMNDEKKTMYEAFKDIEQEVISAKKGNLYDYTTKVDEFKTAMYNVTSADKGKTERGREQLREWLGKNMNFSETVAKRNMDAVAETITEESLINTIIDGLALVNSDMTRSFQTAGTYERVFDNERQVMRHFPEEGGLKAKGMNIIADVMDVDATPYSKKDFELDRIVEERSYARDVLKNSTDDESSGIIRNELKKASQSIIENITSTASSKKGMLAIGLAAAYMITGYVGNNASRPADTQAQEMMNQQKQQGNGFSDYQPGYVPNNSPQNNGYVVNIKGSGSMQTISSSSRAMSQTLNNYMPSDVKVNMNIVESNGDINDRYLDQLLIGAIGQ